MNLIKKVYLGAKVCNVNFLKEHKIFKNEKIYSGEDDDGDPEEDVEESLP